MPNKALQVIESVNWDSICELPSSPLSKPILTRGKGYFHYTSLTAAQKILELHKEEDVKISKDNELYRHFNMGPYITLLASHFLYLNDEEELFQGLERVTKQIKNVLDRSKKSSPSGKALRQYYNMFSKLSANNRANAPNHFILCFCSDGNNLGQWEYYGKDSGIAIEFDLENCEAEGFLANEKSCQIRPYSLYPHNILYKEAEKNQALNKLAQISIETREDVDVFALMSLALASHMKHESFAAEKEIRLLFAPLYKKFVLPSNALDLINYREDSGRIKPYLEIHIKHKNLAKQPIKSITIGPGQNQVLVFDAMKKLIQMRYFHNTNIIEDARNYPRRWYEAVKIGDIEVRRSTIPFRG